ncbi:BTB And Kelch, partial [Ancylostoma duodenale]
MAPLDLDYESVELLISYCYSGKLDAPAEKVRSLFVAAHTLQINDVKEKCSELIITWLTPANALDIKAFCTQMECRKAAEECNRFIQKFFVPISQSDSFLKLSFKDVVEIISMDGLFVASEEDVFEAAFRWASSDVKREEHAP